MKKSNRHYKQMEKYMTGALFTDILFFIFFLISAGLGIIWLKVIMAILAFGTSGLCLAFLYLSKEIFRDRSLWMTVAAAAVILCIFFALLLGYPSPSPI